MKCVIFGPSVKFFARALSSLAKIGEDLYLEAQDDGLALRTTNSSRSAFMCFLFNPPFFNVYELKKSSDSSTHESEGSGSVEQVAKCKLSMKAILMAFRSIGNMDKTVESCTISILASELKTKIELKCRFSAVKTYILPFIECESIKAKYSASQGANHITAQSKILTEMALNFLAKQEEVSMAVDDTKLTMKNFVENEEDTKKTVHTELNMNSAEFEMYSISQKSNITFCLKELRAFIAFAEAYHLPISFCFDTGGNPIVFSIVSPEILEGILIMATLDGQEFETNSTKKQKQTESQTATNQVLPNTETLQSSQLRLQEPNRTEANESFYSRISNVNSRSQAQSKTDSRYASSNGNRGELSQRTSQHNFSFVQPGLSGDPPAHTLTPSSVSAKSCPKDKPKRSKFFNENSDSDEEGEVRLSTKGTTQDPRTSQTHQGWVDLPSEGYEREELIDGTPPPKRAKFFFMRCFDATFNPSKILGADRVLAPDSDDES